MQRRSFIAMLAAVPAVLAACGSDGTTLPPADPGADSTVPPADPVDVTTTEPVPAVDPVDAEVGDATVVLSLTYEGGFTTREFAFQNPPALLVTNDGRAITGAAIPAVYPGPLLPQHSVQTISAAGADRLLDAVADAGLLSELDLELTGDVAIADASTTVLAVNTVDMSIRHEAYALGAGGGPGESTESEPGRQALLEFTDLLRLGFDTLVADDLGDPEPWVPVSVQITVMSMSGVDLGAEATIIDWPAPSSVPLATSGVDTFECREIDDPAIVQLLLDADQATFFRDPGAAGPDDVFQVIARPAYPGRSCDA